MLTPKFPARIEVAARLDYLACEPLPALNIGAGINPIAGAVNADLREGPDIDVTLNVMTPPWPFDAQFFGRVFAFHLLEHIPVTTVLVVFAEAYRVLKPGGVFVAEVPDVVAVAQTLVNGQWGALRNLYAMDRYLGDAHRWGYDASALAVLAAVAGFAAWSTEPGTDYHAGQMPTVRLEAVR
jgi:predicted SAM-dependent methyltransferase